MSRLLRLVTTCLMLLALPLQGWAAAQMLHCTGSTPPAVQQHDADHAHHHAPEGKAQPATGCSACAACCVALALPSRLAPLAGPVADGAQPRPLQAAPVSFVTGGPERPPRAPVA